MNSPAFHPLSTISDAAKAWLIANPPQPRTMVTSDNAEQVRAAVRDGYGPAIAAVRAELTFTETDVTIGGVDCSQIAGRSSSPPVLYFFGGGHTVGSPEEDLTITAPLAVDAGVTVTAPRYSLAPEAPYPAALEQALAVYRALLEHHRDGVVVVGESAGGNLALALTQRARSEGLALPRALALLSPWSDLAFTGDSQLANRDPSLFMTDGDLVAMADSYRGDTPASDPLISQIHADFDGFPPTLITTGTRDLLLSDCVRVAHAMGQANVDVTLRVWEGMWHVFEFYREFPEARESMREVSEFVRRFV